MEVEANVSPANNAGSDVNVDRLKQIDSEVSGAISEVLQAETIDKSASAAIVTAGVRMLDILSNDPDAWSRFKAGDEKTSTIVCKGQGWESREVAKVLWREFKSVLPTRERVSMYGKAIRIAHKSYHDHIDDPDILRASITNARGIKGLIEIDRKVAKSTGRKNISIPIPDVLTLYLIGPGGTREALAPELNRALLVQIRRLQ